MLPTYATCECGYEFNIEEVERQVTPMNVYTCPSCGRKYAYAPEVLWEYEQIPKGTIWILVDEDEEKYWRGAVLVPLLCPEDAQCQWCGAKVKKFVADEVRFTCGHSRNHRDVLVYCPRTPIYEMRFTTDGIYFEREIRYECSKFKVSRWLIGTVIRADYIDKATLRVYFSSTKPTKVEDFVKLKDGRVTFLCRHDSHRPVEIRIRAYRKSVFDSILRQMGINPCLLRAYKYARGKTRQYDCLGREVRFAWRGGIYTAVPIEEL